MILKRLRVEEGFLDGLDLEFDEDLNVLIGGRGVGKTAVIELIRFCLGVPNLDSEMRKESAEHAAGVLQDGLASLTVDLDGESITLTRSIGGPPPHLSISDSQVPIILSQREIETLARTPKGRLNLLDSFVGVVPKLDKLSEARVRSTSAELRGLLAEVDEVEEQLRQRTPLQAELAALKRQEGQLKTKAPSNEAMNRLISESQAAVNELAAEDEKLNQAANVVSRWIQALPQDSQLDMNFDLNLDSSLPTEVREGIQADINTIKAIKLRASDYRAKIVAERSEIRVKKEPIEGRLRAARQTLEAEKAGAGKLVREISRVGEALARLDSLIAMIEQKRKRIAKVHADRIAHLTKITDEREKLFELRVGAAEKLNKALGPHIRISLQHSNGLKEYEQAILAVLKGSYLRYNELAPLIAGELSPHELCEVIHAMDFQKLAKLLGISEDRAHRFISAFREGPIEDVLLAPIHDAVDFCLLDGSTYKDVDQLSIGQRCTVVLSIVFENLNVILVVDQPEDHLDNEFVAATLIHAIRNREMVAQTLVSTHNANVPVLGEASRVVHLESNGEQGFIRTSGSLKDDAVVGAIISVMEGGVQAFSKRATFYGSKNG